MQVTPPLPLLRRVPSGVWTALAWCAGLALTFLMRVRLPGEAEPAYSPGALLYHWDGLSFLMVATALVVAGSILLDRRPLRGLTLLLAASAVACMPLGVGEIPSAQFLAVDAALYFIAATAPRRTSIAAITMSLITLAGYLGTRLLFGWVVGTSAELAVAMTAVIAWLVGRSVHQAHEHAESLRVQATAQAITSERLRIARELHDMVAHSIGIIALQAGAARRVIDTQPVRAREALGEIETVGRETLSGLRRMLGALRHPEPTHPRETKPTNRPKLAQPPHSESPDRSTPADQRPGVLPGQPAPTEQRPDAVPDQPARTEQRPDAVPDQPARTEQRPDALSSRSMPVEKGPAQRTQAELGSRAPFGGSAVVEESFGQCAPAELRSGESLAGSAVAGVIEEDAGRCAPIELESDGPFGGFASVEERPDAAALSRPASVEQGQDASDELGQHASLSQYAPVEPPQRTRSDCPESGQTPPTVPLGQPESGPTPSTAPLDPDLAPLDLAPLVPDLAPLGPTLAPLVPGLAPAGLAELERLAATTTAAGVQVQVRWRGVRRPLPPEIDMSAYRIVQEAVTNVTRHAEHPSCQVTIDFGDDELAIEVIDPAPSPHPGLSLDPGARLASGGSSGLTLDPGSRPASDGSVGLTPDPGSRLASDGSVGLTPDPGPRFPSGRSPALSSGRSPGLSSGSGLALSSDSSPGSFPDPSRGDTAAPALDLGAAADCSSRFGPRLDVSLSSGSGSGLGAVPAHSSGSGAGRGFGFGGGRGRGRGRKAGGGYGLVGMRERVALLHGVFSAGPRQEGGFRVVARLPVPARVR
ncbi:histidine kinase [Nonomuraea sp. NPDC050451]|uniref:histidine kinase n=1 Tax=Nonomuraea sp. NPDC050451 TaxID=3364364 RepID=UPI00379FD671